MAETSQSVEDDCEDIDLKNKMAIAHNILKACIKEKAVNRCIYHKDKWNKLHFLTNISETLMNKIFCSFKIPSTINIYKGNLLDTPELHAAVRHGFIYLYKNNEIPTNASMQRMTCQLSRHSEISKQQLERCGYIWRQLPKTNRTIIMEHPLQTIQRQRYLERLHFYRQQNRPLVYVMEKIMDKEDENNKYLKNYTQRNRPYVVFNVIVSGYKYIHGNVFTCNTIQNCYEMLEKTFIKNILHQLPQSSVIISEEKPYYNKSLPVPTIESEKCVMMKWLDINNIPYDESYHRGELFELIERLKVKIPEKHKFDAIVRSHGHEILYRPHKAKYLCYFKPIWDNILVLTMGNKDITKVIKDKESFYWQLLENFQMAIEDTVYTEDLEIENITDKILTMARTSDLNAWAKVECDREEDSLKRAEYLIEI